MAVFYLFYRLLLSRDTFHRFNRMALLGVIVFSIAIPFVQLAADEPVTVQRTALELERFLQMGGTPVEEESRFPSWLAALFMIYAGGCLFFAGRLLYSVCQIVRLIRSGERAVLEDGTRLVVTDLTVSPFSWMKYIVISRIDMEESGAEILAHEQAHIRACHSLDMWFAGCCAVLHWFNPAVWLLKQELQNVHEYEADESVIAHGVDAKHYQLLLIKKAVGAQRFTSMANSFDHSKLKKRITMMLKQKSNPWARLKFLYVLPLAAVAVAAFARPEISRRLENISEVEFAEVLTSRQDKKMSQTKKDKPLLRPLEFKSNMRPAEGFQNWRGMVQSGGRRVMKNITLDLTTLQFCTPEMLDRYRKEIPLMADYQPEAGVVPTNSQVYRVYIERYLCSLPVVNQDLDLIISQKEATMYGVPIQVYFFSRNKVWKEYERIQSDIFDHLLAMVPKFDLKVYQYSD